jgi:hypothetical protein
MTDSTGAMLPTVFQQYIAQSKYCRWIQRKVVVKSGRSRCSGMSITSSVPC